MLYHHCVIFACENYILRFRENHLDIARCVGKSYSDQGIISKIFLGEFREYSCEQYCTFLKSDLHVEMATFRKGSQDGFRNLTTIFHIASLSKVGFRRATNVVD